MSDIGPVLLLAGGLSPEREVALRSGSRLQAVLRNVGVEADIADVDAALIPALEACTPAVVFPALFCSGRCHSSPGRDKAFVIRDVCQRVRRNAHTAPIRPHHR